jgi:hypothetical protein
MSTSKSTLTDLLEKASVAEESFSLGLRQRRKLGLTRGAIRNELKAVIANYGEEDADGNKTYTENEKREMSVEILLNLTGQPAYSAAWVDYVKSEMTAKADWDWDAIIEFIVQIITLLITLFG